MNFSRSFARQLARPTGAAGRLLGSAMDFANHKPVRVALELLDAKPGESILDAGCGTGEAIRQLLGQTPCHAAGIDPSEAMIKSARRKLGSRAQFTLAAIETAPFDHATFDAILALNVLYFCTEDGAMLQALRRMLRPGGRLVAYVSDRASMESWSFARAGLHRLYDAESLHSALTDAGFAPERITVQEGQITRGIKGLWAVARV